MKFKTLIMSHFDLPLFFDMFKQLLAPGPWPLGVWMLSVLKNKVNVMSTSGLQGAGSEALKPEKLQIF